jgi:hypothetical protein
MGLPVLTYGTLQKRLQIANCCAAKKGAELLEKYSSGLSCKKDQKKIQRMLDLVDSIKEYAVIIPTKQARLVYDASSWTGGSATFTFQIFLNFLIGGSNIRTVVGQSSVDGAFAAMVASFNGLGLGTIASYDSSSKIFILINPTDIGTTGNGKTALFAASGGGAPLIPSPSGTFSGGVDGNENTQFDDTNTCLKTNEIYSILDKLCDLCNEPCETVVNF